MLPPSVADHPDLHALEVRLRHELIEELLDESRRDAAERKIFEALVKLEISLLNRLPSHGDVLW